jgi:predicted Zn-dependent protease
MLPETARRSLNEEIVVRIIQARVFLWVVLVALSAGAGCGPATGGGQGPGGRRQALALSPYQELNLGEQAYREVLKKYRRLPNGPEVEKVRQIGERIAKASENEPLQREMNLRVKGFTFAWEFNVLESNQVNAFCLPGGKVAVFTGLLPLASENGRLIDDQLATVMSHEIAHALAHHASERIARQQKYQRAMEALNGALGSLPPEQRQHLIGLLSAGASVGGLSYDRQQESEADHIGLFLMTFAGYDPRQALVFWQKMEALAAKGGRPPEILSDHPSDARRIAQIRRWIPAAQSGYAAWKAGRIAPARR